MGLKSAPNMEDKKIQELNKNNSHYIQLIQILNFISLS